MNPNFLIIGAQKAGTTSLINHLSRHPDIFAPKNKEICCYYDDEEYNKQFDRYPFKNYFKNWNGEKYVGNAPVNLLYFAEKSAKRIFRANSSIKLIVLLRNPIDRAYSAYWYFVRCGIESLSFEEALQREFQILKNGTFQELSDLTYVSHGYYHDQLVPYFKYFDKKQILVLLYENLSSNPVETLKQVYNFLEIKYHEPTESPYKKFNARSKAKFQFINNFIFNNHPIKKSYKQIIPASLQTKVHDRIISKILDKNRTPLSSAPMTSKTRAQLVSIFNWPNKQLETFLNTKLIGWE